MSGDAPLSPSAPGSSGTRSPTAASGISREGSAIGLTNILSPNPSVAQKKVMRDSSHMLENSVAIIRLCCSYV